jgi:Secretion system C-terminal sorting domain
MKNFLLIVYFIFAIGCMSAIGQNPATRSVVVGIGRSNCSSGTSGVQNFTYTGLGGLNLLSQIGAMCQPNLASPFFTNSRAVVDYNPKDQNLYYFRRFQVAAGPPAVFDTYVYRWSPTVCPGAGPGLVAIDTFFNEYLTVAFDAAGNGWMIKFGATIPYSLTMRKVDFTTGTVGLPENITLPAGVNLYTSNGDYLITPGGNLFFAYDNKLLTVNYKDYGISPLNATYIDTISLPVPGQNLVGLAYADGDFVGSFIKTSGGTVCGYSEVDILTGDLTGIIRPAGETFTSFDNTSIISGVGVAKKLVSVTPTGTAGRYTVAYDVFVKNYGNYPVSNIQVIDSLQFINGLANVVPGTVSSTFIDNPGLLNRNAAYNGTTNASLLLAGQTLVNSPLAKNRFTIRITADITGVTPGIIYYNAAVATGVGFTGLAVRDSSTNGTNPDLNLNEKPDDFGESLKTPFVITVAGEASPCSNLKTVLHNQNFNTPTNQTTMPAGSSSAYTGSLTIPLPEEGFIITNNANTHYPAYWNAITDHSGTGRMMIVNADVNNSVIYSAAVSGLCSNLKYSFSGWIANISNAAQTTFCNAVGGVKAPKLIFRVKDAVSGAILSSISSGNIIGSGWAEYGMRFVLPTAYSNIIIEVINEGEGGCGNDLAIDDIKFGLCDADPVVGLNHINAGCLGTSASFTATLADPTIISGTPDYQWQSSSDGITWTVIGGAPNNATYTIASVAAGDVNKYYRAIVAATGNLGNASCRYTTPSFFLVAGCDIDDDNDGIPDTVESGGADPLDDDDLDGIPNYRDSNYPGFVDTNGDAVNDNFDNDLDGRINELDLDSDNDGIPDVTEAGGVDGNGDGVIDSYTDTDNDGFSQNVDANNTGKNASGNGLALPDLDGDLVPNYFDLDSDGDGILDVLEALGSDTNNDGIIDGYTDTDKDGFSDNVDGDVGNDGVAENITFSLLRTGSDGDNNGRADNYPFKNIDKDGRSNPYDLDSDGDGLSDVAEIHYGQIKISGTTLYNDANSDGYVDGANNILGRNISIATLVSISLPDFDGDGKKDYLDIDADNDGATDNIEIMTSFLPGAAYLIPTAGDADNDGLDDQYDNFLGQFKGGRVTPVDTDADGTPDYLDLDTDSDGQLDIIECNDNNFNGWADDNVTLTNLDTDGDGLDNRFDNDNTNHKVTSSNMGTAGSFTGPAPTGTLSMVTRSYSFQSDRDWRFNGMILSVNLLSFNGNLYNQSARLSWTFIANEAIANFIVERSFDGINFTTIATLPGTTIINQQQNVVYTDAIGSLLSTKVYYRLKMMGTNARQKQSQVIVLKVEKQVSKLQVMPTPADTYFNVNFAVAKNGKAQVELVDANGKVVTKKEVVVYAGTNTILFNNVEQYPTGIYVVKVLVNQETIYGRVIIK